MKKKKRKEKKINSISLFVVVQSLSYIWLSVTSWTAACQASLSFIISQSLLKFTSIESVRLSKYYPLLPTSPFAFFNLSKHQGDFQWVGSLHQVAKVLELQLQHKSFQWIFRTDFFYKWLLWYPCSPRELQESSLAPQFKSISSSVLSLLYGQTLTSVHDYWKNHSFDYKDLCWQSDAFAFEYVA